MSYLRNINNGVITNEIVTFSFVWFLWRKKSDVEGESSITTFRYAEIAQLAEQLICNQQVVGSTPVLGSKQYLDLVTEWSNARSGKEKAS